MKNYNFKKIKTNGGQAMLISVVFFLFISLATISGLVSPSVREFKIANDLIRSGQSYFLSESGVEDAYYRLKNAKPIGSSTSIILNGNTAITNITDSGYNEKTISSVGDVSDRERKNAVVVNAGQGIAFNYGIQAGQGGFSINKATVNGNVFANGSIIGTHSGNRINGTAISAGPSGLISAMNIGQNGTGNAQAHTINDSTVEGNLYCITGSGNNKVCNSSLPDPDPIPMPITQVMIDQWKADANINNDTVVGNLTISTPTQLGPKKITGNLTINANLTLTGTVYVVGNIITANNVHVSLSPSYGTTGGILITDGPVNLSNNVVFEGSGSANSYIMLLTTSSCPSGCGSTYALEIANNVGAVILNAQNGTAHMNNNVTLNEVVANRIVMDNNAVVNYLSGLANMSFTSGPSGGWNIKNWKETQ
ncbi:MAG: hypothetical protein WC662_05035 [Candidatus Paceibacterota bacterium]|jgi:hypothetical protein